MRYSKKIKNRLNRLKIGLNQRGRFWANFGSLFILVSLLGACASVQQPNGGPKDVAPPKVLKEKPKNQSTRFAGKEIEIEFDEFIKLNNEFSEVSISPSMESQPILKAQKEKLSIKLEGELEANTTYTLNFGKAIGDVNENNILKNYSYVFSTGEVLDSLSISGNVKTALKNENLKEAMVFIFPAQQDSLLGKKRPSIYTQTDSAGNFTLKNLRANQYRIYALKESASDRIYNPGEDEIGFLDSVIDLKKNVAGLRFRVFKEEPAKFKINDRKIENDGTVLLTFNKGLTQPDIKETDDADILNTAKKEFSLKGDSVRIWFPELTFDSLKLAIYDQGKELERVSLGRNKRDTPNRTPLIGDNLSANKLKPGSDLLFMVSYPVSKIDSNKIRLISDSIDLSGWKLNRLSGSDRKFVLTYPFRIGKKYQIELNEGAFTAITGLKNKAYQKTFSADDPENYGNLSLSIIPPSGNKQYVVQLLNEKDLVLRQDIISGSKKTILYSNYTVGKYAIRVILDENKNGTWDTGSIAKQIQPEKVWIYNKTLTLRANWDLEETITLPQDW